jgi:hypothetical protein
MLEFARSEDLSAGSNLADTGPDTTWIHLLPSLEPVHLGWFGQLDRATAALLANARHTTLLSETTLHEPAPGGRRLALVHGSAGAAPHGQDPRLDLVLLPLRVASYVTRRPELMAPLVAMLAPTATLCIVPDPDERQRRLRSSDLDRLAAALGVLPIARLSVAPDAATDPPVGGLVMPDQRRSVVGRARSRTRLVVDLVVQRLNRVAGRGPGRGTRAHASDIRLHRPAPIGRRGSVAGSAGGVVVLRRDADLAHAPDYLVRLADSAGVDLTGIRWAVAPPRGYRSQKVIFALSREGSRRPDLMVKMTQEPRFNVRLDNERRALELLADMPMADGSVVPRVVFSGTHAGLLVVGETALEGERFRSHSTATPDCRVAGAAIAWLTDLAAETVDRGPDRGTLDPPVRTLADRYVTTFETPPAGRSVLSWHVETLVSAAEAIPAVVSHGDPGTWNLLVRPDDGRVCFLDWENAERAGLPAWDLMLFLKTFAGFVSQAAGHRRSTDGLVDLLCGPGPFNALARDSFRAYAERLGLDRELLPSLVLLCWVHQSLKETTRLEPGRMAQSRSARVVARCLADPQLLRAMTGVRR